MDRLVAYLVVVCAVGIDGLYSQLGLIEQLGYSISIKQVFMRADSRYYKPRFVINCDVQLAPGPSLELFSQPHVPLALTVYFKARRIYKQMKGLLICSRPQLNLQVAGAPGKG